MKRGEFVEYKGEKATIIKIDDERINKDWAKILIKETGESRYVKIEDLLIESEKK